MKYIIMCGSSNGISFEKPRQLLEINNEPIVARTIRLLKEAGIQDIAITSDKEVFSNFGVEWINYNSNGIWVNAFYPIEGPVCYLYGDVVYSPEAINTIVNTEIGNVMYFASRPPFNANYCKKHAEPFAFKVKNTRYFFECVRKLKQLYREGRVRRAISWELWQVIKNTTLDQINYNNYVPINDYTCDVDKPEDVQKIENCINNPKHTKYLIHSYQKRLWYVNQYLIPSLIEQGVNEAYIALYNDDKGEGNLKACMNAFMMVEDNDESTWHLQDDVIISKDFKKKTDTYNRGLVCGFSSLKYDGPGKIGVVRQSDMWFSFPCICIPNKYARECSKWVNEELIGNAIYKQYWQSGRNDDWAFRQYLKVFHKNDNALNLTPNIVDHIDYLLGGGSGGQRKEQVRSQYFKDTDIVQELEWKIKNQ